MDRPFSPHGGIRDRPLDAERLEAAIEHTSESVILTDSDGTMVYVNPAFERITGYPRAEAIGRNPRILQSGVHTDAFYAAMWATLLGGQTWTGELVNRRKDGSLYTEEASISPVPGPSGGCAGYVAVKRDVTAERRAEAALRASDARLREISHLAGVAGWSYDLQTGVLEWSDEMYVLYGRDRALGPVSADETEAVYGPGSYERLQKAAAATIASGEPFVVEIEVFRADGTLRDIEDRGEAVRDESGRIVGLSGTVVDMTERSRAERALRESEERYRSLFGGMQEGLAYCRMLYVDGRPDDWVYLEVNDAFTRQTGLHGVVGRRASEAIPGIRESDPGLVETYGRVASGAGPERFETFVTAMDEWFSVAVYSPAPEHFVAIFEVISERKRAEARVLESARMEAIGRLAGGVAHDFNNVLTTIFGSAEILAGIGAGDDAALREVDAIRDAAERAAALTRQLLALGRRQPVTPAAVDVAEAIDGLTPMLRRTLGEDVELRVTANPGARPVRIDRQQLGQIVINLAFNARDAMPEGGTLTVDVAPTLVTADHPRGRTRVEPGAYTRLAISDTGTGIPDPVIDHIFEPFFTTKETEHGTGLGLATVESIVLQAGGAIGVESHAGHGTTFEILLPCASAEVEVVDPGAAVGARPGTGSILLVEDEDAVREVTSRILTGLGYSVVEASRASEALAIDRRLLDALDLLVTDVVMPGMTGVRLSAVLTRRNPRLRTLFVSGYTPDSALIDRVRAPGTAFLPKPFTRDQIGNVVARLLDPDTSRVAGSGPGPGVAH